MYRRLVSTFGGAGPSAGKQTCASLQCNDCFRLALLFRRRAELDMPLAKFFGIVYLLATVLTMLLPPAMLLILLLPCSLLLPLLSSSVQPFVLSSVFC